VPREEQPEQVLVERDYLHEDSASRDEIIERFIERVTDYKAKVQRVEEQDLSAFTTFACYQRGIRSLIVPTDMPQEWLPVNVTLLRDTETAPLTREQIERSDGVLTGCALGIAQTGTIVLDSGTRQGRRILSLLPDYALCLIWEDQITGLVPEAITRLNEPREAGTGSQKRPLTFISGPSATSDIELKRVEGVHGPRTLEVFVVHPATPELNADRENSI
jgi:L-lactate dehydrogenase complex protein LldG